MATIGQALPQPESGWKRYDIKLDTKHFNFSGDWEYITNSNYLEGGTARSKTSGDKVEFYFKGTSIRIISVYSAVQSEKVEIQIDNLPIESFKLNATTLFNVLVYEKQNLSNEVHKVVITNKYTDSTKSFFALDSLDIIGEIAPPTPEMRMILKNPTTNEHFSLDDNTLIPLPDGSDKNMILYGIEQGKEIQLDVPFNKHLFHVVTEESTANGRIFTTNIRGKYLIKSIGIEKD